MFKTALTHLRGRSSDSATLMSALRLIGPNSGHLECVHVRPTFTELIRYAPSTGPEDNSSAILDVLGTLRIEASAAAKRASDAFAAFCSREGVLTAGSSRVEKTTAAFQELAGNEIDQLIVHVRSYDLVVVKGGGEEAGGVTSEEVGRLLMYAGRPVVLAPNALAPEARTIAIAWKDAPEAARAVAAALPVIEKAAKVLAFHVSEEDEPRSTCESVVSYLRGHHVGVSVHHVEPRGRNAADSLLEATRAAEVDLLVMGAYGRNRLSELVFGGFTQRVLEDASLSVFLLH